VQIVLLEMPTYADVAPEVMEAFGTWFNDLRRKKKYDRGHKNAVVFLRENSGNAAMDALITEVVDPYSHLLRLEEMQRAAMTSAEAQWRSMFSKSGSLPRGPAVIAARLFSQLTVRGESMRRVVGSEETQRQHIIAARDGWIREVVLRAEYELECMQRYVLEQLALRATSSVESIVNAEESARKGMSEVAEDLLRGIHVQCEASFVRMCRLVFAVHARAKDQQSVMPLLASEEAASRAALVAAADKHALTINIAFEHQLALMCQMVHDRLTTNQAALTSVLSNIHAAEARERQHLADAEASHCRDIVIRSRREQEAMQRGLLQKMSVHQGQYERLQQRVERQLFAGESALRAQLVEAYIRWVTQVATQGLLAVIVQSDRLARHQCHIAPRVHLKDTERLMNSEFLARLAIQRARQKWVDVHFTPMERMERIEIPKRIAQRALEEMAINRQMSSGKLQNLPRHIRAQMELERTEQNVRQQIVVSEKRWRIEASQRMKQMLGDNTSLGAQIQALVARELAVRDALVVSEAAWRSHQRQTMMVTIGRLDDARNTKSKLVAAQPKLKQPVVAGKGK
jgi:hypothetical protein